MSNLLLNKPAFANNSYAPFLPSRAVDGVVAPASRWVASVVPAWLSVDMGDNYYVSQYKLAFMGAAGWPIPPDTRNYNVKDFRIQGSLDGITWIDLDTVHSNPANVVNRPVTSPRLVRYLRAYVSSGLNANPGVASIVDFEASELAGAPFLSDLLPSVGTLNPAFRSRNLVYSMNVENGVSSMAFTPTAVQTNMEIRVKDRVVASGSQSQQIALEVGNNSIPVTVKSADGAILTAYTVVVNRAGVQAFLNSLVVKNNRNQDVALVPPFDKQTFTYTASQAAGIASVTITPTADNPSATILVNGTPVPSGTTSAPISLQTGQNTVTILINSITSYSIVITKG